jgi:hypothetical protein
LKHINFDDKTIAQMQCQNGREMLSLMKFGAKEAMWEYFPTNALGFLLSANKG